MNPRSGKAKSRRLQNAIRDTILEHFSNLKPDDVRCAIMGESGEDIKLSPAAREVFPYSVEAKNQESLSIWAALKQAQENCPDGITPLLVFKRNHTETFVTLKLDDFIKLL